MTSAQLTAASHVEPAWNCRQCSLSSSPAAFQHDRIWARVGMSTSQIPGLLGVVIRRPLCVSGTREVAPRGEQQHVLQVLKREECWHLHFIDPFCRMVAVASLPLLSARMKTLILRIRRCPHGTLWQLHLR